MSGKIAYIRMGSSLAANRRVLQLLQDMFPDKFIQVIDVSRIIQKKHKLVSLIFAFGYYGLDILFNNNRFCCCKHKNPYMFNTIRRLIKDELSNEEYLFSFQIQSLFDGSTGKFPPLCLYGPYPSRKS